MFVGIPTRNPNRRLRIRIGARARGTTSKRAAPRHFREMETLRRPPVRSAGRIIRPGGKLIPSMNGNDGRDGEPPTYPSIPNTAARLTRDCAGLCDNRVNFRDRLRCHRPYFRRPGSDAEPRPTKRGIKTGTGFAYAQGTDPMTSPSRTAPQPPLSDGEIASEQGPANRRTAIRCRNRETPGPWALVGIVPYPASQADGPTGTTAP